MKKVYITKYALTRGILLCDLLVERDDFVIARIGPGWLGEQHFSGKEYHHTLQDAEAHVRVMVANKLRALERQRQKLLEFEARVVEV